MALYKHKHVEEEIKRQNESLAALNAVSAAAVSSLELDIVLRQIIQRTCQALNATEGSILLQDPATGDLFFAVSLTKKTTDLRKTRLAPGQGIAGWVIQSGQPVRIDDVRLDPRWHPAVDAAIDFETRSLLCAPLSHREKITGVIEIVNKREGIFDQDDLNLLVAVASIAAAALENARLFGASQARIRELALLNEIGLAVTATLEHDQVIRAALFLIQRFFEADGIFLLTPAPPSGELVYAQALVEAAPRAVPLRLSPGEGIAGWIMEQRRAVLIKDAQDDPRFSRRLDQHLGAATRALMAVPLLTLDKAIGVLEVVSWQSFIYTSDDLRLLQSVASTLTVALENARLYLEQKQLLQDRERAQLQLIHSEKMSALGRLAASIAHEINNPLQAIQGCLTLAEEELAEQQRREKLTRYINIVTNEIDRIATFVRHMREFYRPAREGRKAIDVHDLLSGVLTLTDKQLQESQVNITRHWAQELPPIQANPDRLRQVFLNLVLNAIDAMPNGGTLGISTALDRISRDGLHVPESDRTAYIDAIRIDFSDNGIGLSSEAQSRLFEPFFTSKEHGSGLGLSISYGIIESHNGQIKIESQEGVGTTFTILLPAGPSLPDDPQETKYVP